MIMGVAVAGILDALAASSRNVIRLTQADRAVILARTQDGRASGERRAASQNVSGRPVYRRRGGSHERRLAGARHARRIRSGATDRNWVIDRIELEIWWMDGATRHSFSLEGYRRALLPPGEGI